MGIAADRAKLIARLQIEARAFQNAGARPGICAADGCSCLLNAGTVLGLWSRSASGKASDVIYHGMPVRGLSTMLTPRTE